MVLRPPPGCSGAPARAGAGVPWSDRRCTGASVSGARSEDRCRWFENCPASSMSNVQESSVSRIRDVIVVAAMPASLTSASARPLGADRAPTRLGPSVRLPGPVPFGASRSAVAADHGGATARTLHEQTLRTPLRIAARHTGHPSVTAVQGASPAPIARSPAGRGTRFTSAGEDDRGLIGSSGGRYYDPRSPFVAVRGRRRAPRCPSRTRRRRRHRSRHPARCINASPASLSAKAARRSIDAVQRSDGPIPRDHRALRDGPPRGNYARVVLRHSFLLPNTFLQRRHRLCVDAP